MVKIGDTVKILLDIDKVLASDELESFPSTTDGKTVNEDSNKEETN